jgi:mediator of RNA polymerase II transcription subunit 12
VFELNQCSVPTKDPSVEETAAVSLISAYEFHVIRSYLEQSEDLAILADVVGITASSLDSAVLASVADTLHYHTKAFRAIGAFDPLFGRVAMRYAAIRTVRFPEREFLLSLQHLARTAQPEGQLLQLLSYDLSRLDHKNSIAACSPASDNMGEVMQHFGTYSDDEIERILLSGTSMDQQMMARVLRKIVHNLEEHVDKGYQQFENYTTWFWRLRNFDESTFDVVLQEWLNSCLTACQLHTLSTSIPPLVSSGCMSLSSFLDDLRTCLSPSKRGQLVDPCTIAVEGLRILLPTRDLIKSCSPSDAYRYRSEQYDICFDSDTRIVLCIGEVAELVSSVRTMTAQQALSNLLCSASVSAVVKQHIVSDPDCLSKMKVGQSGLPSSSCFKTLLDNLLDPFGESREHFPPGVSHSQRLIAITGLAQATSEEQIVAVFKIASELSLPICQAMIEFIFSSEYALGVDAADALSAALLNAVRTAVEEDQSQGLELLTSLDTALTDKVITSLFLRNSLADIIRFDVMLNVRSLMRLLFSLMARSPKLTAMAQPLRYWSRNTLLL